MALELTTFDADFGAQLPDVYAKVIFFALDVQGEQIGLDIALYANKAAADAKKPYVKVIHVGIGPTAQVVQAEVKHPVSGEVLVPEVKTPTYAEVAGAGAGKTAFDSVKAIIYALVKVKVPQLAGAKDV